MVCGKRRKKTTRVPPLELSDNERHPPPNLYNMRAILDDDSFNFENKLKFLLQRLEVNASILEFSFQIFDVILQRVHFLGQHGHRLEFGLVG